MTRRFYIVRQCTLTNCYETSRTAQRDVNRRSKEGSQKADFLRKFTTLVGGNEHADQESADSDVGSGRSDGRRGGSGAERGGRRRTTQFRATAAALRGRPATAAGLCLGAGSLGMERPSPRVGRRTLDTCPRRLCVSFAGVGRA